MVDQTDDQLLKELEEIGDMADLQDDPNIQFQEASTQQPAEPTSEKELPDSQGGVDAAKDSDAPVQEAKEGEAHSAKAEAPDEAAAEHSIKKPALPAPVPKKRGLSVVKKASAAEPAAASPADEKPAKKKIAARVVKAAKADAAPEADANPGQGLDQEAPEDPSKGPSKPAVKKTSKKAAGPENAGPKVKRAKNAFIYFSAEKRAAVKAEHPTLSMGEMAKKLGELWKAASSEEKATYEAMAEKDKERAAAERTQLKGAAAAGKQPQKPRAKTAYQLFCDGERLKVKEAAPEAKFGELMSLLAAKWKEVSDADKERFEKMHEELRAQLLVPEKAAGSKPIHKNQKAEQALSDEEEPDQERATEDMEIDPSPPSKQASLDSSKTSEQAAVAEAQSLETDDHYQNPKGDAAEEDEDSIVAEMMKVDWKAHPAEYIMAETADSKFLVKRKGLDFTGCGMADARAAKHQRVQQPGEGTPSQSPLSVVMVDEWESFQKSFRCAVHAHKDNGELDMDDLNEGSPLEMCRFLGTMREPTFPLHKTAKNDATIKVPMLELSKAVQRIIDVERKANDDLREELAAAKAALAAKEQALSAGKAAGREFTAPGDAEE